MALHGLGRSARLIAALGAGWRLAAASAGRGPARQRPAPGLAPAPGPAQTAAVAGLEGEQAAGAQHEAIARAAVHLAQLAPDLARLSEEIAAGAAAQAEQATLLAGLAERMTGDLAALARSLRISTRDAGAIVGMIERIASQTRLLSINAAIEAARSGRGGAAFSVIAREIQALAQQTTAETAQVVATISAIREQAHHAEAVIGHGAGGEHLPAPSADLDTGREAALDQLNDRIRTIVDISAAHAHNAGRLSAASAVTRQRCEDMLLAVGASRFAVHRCAAQAISQLADRDGLRSGVRLRQEACLRQALDENAFIDLLYLTDANGHQQLPNVARPGFNAVYGSSGEGRNWSDRPWFRAIAAGVTAFRTTGGERTPAPRAQVYTSDLYRSLATDGFCFTVSTALFGDEGAWLGVLAADVDLARLL